MVETKISIKNSAGETLVGLENRPEEIAAKNPAMILVHGFGADKREMGVYDKLAQELVDRKIFVYRFDLSGCGESEGDYSETSLTKLAGDIIAISSYVLKQPQLDVTKIGYAGFSLGTPTLLVAKPEAAACLLFLSGVATPRPILEKLFGSGFHPEGISERTTNSGRLVKIKPGFWSDFDKHDVLRTLKTWSVPVLIVHNRRDEIVPLDQAEMLFDAAPGLKEKIIVDDSGHAIKVPEIFSPIADWCQKNLQA